MACAEILDHLVGVQDIAADLRTPFDFLLLPFELSLLFLTFLQFEVIEARLEDAQGILPVVELRACLGVFDNDTRWNVTDADSGLHFVDVLAAGAAGTVGVPFEVSRVDFNFNAVVDERIDEY